MAKFYWVLDDLAFSGQITPLDREEILKAGIGAIVSLTLVPLKSSDFPGIELLHLPMEEKVPRWEQIKEYLSFLRLMKTMKRKTLTHCYAGLERSPTMVAIYLIHSGLAPSQALMRIRSLCPEAINEEEEGFLQELPSLFVKDCEETGILLEELLNVMRVLRQKCPWDREQTAESLSKYLIEESWELNAAIKEKDRQKIVAELGDVLLQVVFHAVIGEEEKEFDLSEVIKILTEKLIRRHPHVFAHAYVSTPQGVEKQWEQLKEGEERTKLEKERRYMPALMRAERIQETASHNGFDWDSASGILEKVKEETVELESSLEEGKKERIAEEIGDLFFALVNLSRFLKINPEEALHRATDKFLERYERALKKIRQKGLEPGQLSPEELDKFWNESKKKDRI